MVDAVTKKVGEWLRSDAALARITRAAVVVLAFLVVVQRVWHLTLGNYISGIATGSLYGIIGVGIILIYRTNRLINFAAGAVGAVPAVFFLILSALHHISYFLLLPFALITGAISGALIDVTVMRRFAQSPRLIATVVTVGVAQGLSALGFFIPIWLGAKANETAFVTTPWHSFQWKDVHGRPILTGDEAFAIVSVVIVAILLASFLRYTRIGIALRASAENADRALLLGIPVALVGTVAWTAAGLLSATAIYVQAPLTGVPQNVTLGFDTLLYGLAAAVVARMERMGVALVAGMGFGVLIFGSVSRTGRPEEASALMLVVILLALLAQRKTMSRAYDTGVSSWDVVKSFRPIPSELRGLREVETARYALWGLALLTAIGAPFVIKSANMGLLTQLPIFGLIGVSLVVLTGWAGQISLGQFGLVGAGALVSGGLIANHNIDFFAAMALGIVAGVVVAVLVGLPAVRIQGLYLAVTTLAFGYAMAYFLNENYWIGRHLLPKGLTANINRPILYGRIDLSKERNFYYVCVVFLALAIAAALAFRKNRSGRVLIAARDNQRAAPAYAINLTRTRLAAFAVSGGMAGAAGVLFAYSQHQVIQQAFSIDQSITIFLAAVIGGLTSVPWAVIGVLGLEWFKLFGPHFYGALGQNFITIVPLLLTGPLLIVNMYFYPGGSAESGFQNRDRFLRWVAARHNILVPSLVADRRVEEQEKQLEADIVVEAERHVEEVESMDSITCPVCGESMPLIEAPAHEHLQPKERI